MSQLISGLLAFMRFVRAFGYCLAALGVLLGVMWLTDGSGHGEVAFLFIGAATLLSVGMVLVAISMVVRLAARRRTSGAHDA